MLEKTYEDFKNDLPELVRNVIANDDFVKIATDYGNAVLISETEWNNLVEFAEHILCGKK